MTGTFTPHTEVLPPPQLDLWPRLAPLTELGFVLYGGTAIALRLGHRTSIDFDFFATRALERDRIRDALPFAAMATVLQDERNAWTLLIPHATMDEGAIKVSFFGLPGFGRVEPPDSTDDGILCVASIVDLMATKLKVILQRAEAKDYRDIAALLNAGAELSRGLAAARAIYGPNFQPSESLKALTYFEDGDLRSLEPAEKRVLVDAARAVRKLPDVGLLPETTSGT